MAIKAFLYIVPLAIALLATFQNCSGFKGQAANYSSLVGGTSYCSQNPADATCAIASQPSCSFNGKSIGEGASVSAYLTSTVDSSSTCTSQTRTCENGVLSGNYSFASCSPGGPAACLFDGATVPSGSSISAYLTSAVAFGSKCIFETRTCNNGVLSGSNAYSSCAIAQAASCLFNGQTIAHGASVTAYPASTVSSGLKCTGSTRTCYNGALSGSGDFASCSVSAFASCLFNGQTIASGGTVTAYATSSVPSGSSCQPVARTCTNGSLSGSGDYATCSVNQPACLVGSTTVASGSTITLYTMATAPASVGCATEVRTCSSGVLSGSATSTSCRVMADVTTKLLASSNTGYATAGFHPRIVANGKGIFVSYETDRTDSSVTETTHIDWSRDGGSSFQSLFSRVMSSTASSALQSDEQANLFMADLDQGNQNGRIFVFNGYNNFADAPAEFSLNYPSSAPPGSTKFSFFYAGNNVGFFSDKHRLFRLNFSNQTASAPLDLLVAPNATGLRGNPQYSYMAKTDAGQLLFGWTTQLVQACASGASNCTPSDLNGNYLDNHFMISGDLGSIWSNGNSNLSLPVISDSQDPSSGAIELTMPSDISLALNLQGDNFLHALYSKGNFVHFVYMNKGGGGVAKYGRYNLSTHKIDIAPKPFRGESIKLDSNGISLVSQAGYPLYAVGATAKGDGTGSIAVLVSDDDGVTWSDYAFDTSAPGNLQYMSAAATLSSDNSIVGEFTKLNSSDNSVYFFKIPARVLAPTVTPPSILNFKSSGGFFASSPGGGGANSPLTVDKTSVQGWEQFGLEIINSNQLVSGSQIYLQSPTSYYVSVQCGGGNDTSSTSCGRAQSTVLSPSTYETLTIEKVGGSSGDAIANGSLIRLRASGGYYCSATGGGGAGSTMACNNSAPGDWETFTIGW